jgi:hypothetical protein
MPDEKAGDKVNRDGLDYRAGYVEALNAFMTSLQYASLRAKRGEMLGMEAARQLALTLRNKMLEKMKAG